MIGLIVYLIVVPILAYLCYTQGQINGHKVAKAQSAARFEHGHELTPASLVQDKKYQAQADVSDCMSAANLLMQVVDALDAKEGPIGDTYLVESSPVKDRCITIASRLERLASRLRRDA